MAHLISTTSDEHWLLKDNFEEFLFKCSFEVESLLMRKYGTVLDDLNLKKLGGKLPCSGKDT